MDADPRHHAIERAMIEPALEIAGRRLRPFGLTTFVLLKKLGNRLVTTGVSTVKNAAGVDVIDFNDVGNLEAILAFVWVHSAPITEVVRASRDPEAFAEAVMLGTADIPMASLFAAAEEITKTLAAASQSATEAKADEEPRGDDDPNAHGPRG